MSGDLCKRPLGRQAQTRAGGGGKGGQCVWTKPVCTSQQDAMSMAVALVTVSVLATIKKPSLLARLGGFFVIFFCPCTDDSCPRRLITEYGIRSTATMYAWGRGALQMTRISDLLFFCALSSGQGVQFHQCDKAAASQHRLCSSLSLKRHPPPVLQGTVSNHSKMHESIGHCVLWPHQRGRPGVSS